MSRPQTIEVPSLPHCVDGTLAQLLGSAPDERDAVVHVCSSWEDERGVLRAIRVGPGAPLSPLDSFLLHVARAQADAIVTSGSIVRSEPGLEHGLGGGALRDCLTSYRRERLAKTRPPVTLVLSRSGDLPPQHPLWDDWTSVRIWTDPSRVASLRRRLPAHVEVVPAMGESASLAIAALAAEGCERISLELGPRGVQPLYGAGQIDSLWGSRYLGRGLARHTRGDAWPFGHADLHDWCVGQGVRVQEPSGPWCFARYLPRRATG